MVKILNKFTFSNTNMSVAIHLNNNTSIGTIQYCSIKFSQQLLKNNEVCPNAFSVHLRTAAILLNRMNGLECSGDFS